MKWLGDGYQVIDKPAEAKKGQRPIIAYCGGPGNKVAVQFCEANKKIVGADVSIGSAAPVRGVIEALGHAASVLINAQSASSLAVPSASIIGDDGASTTVVVSADDSVVAAALGKNKLYGAYHNVITVDGVSALWNGVITTAPASVDTSRRRAVPAVVAGGFAAVPLHPNNLAHAAKHIVFYEKGAQNAPLSVDDAVKRMLDLTDAVKEGLVRDILKNAASISVAGTAQDIVR